MNKNRPDSSDPNPKSGIIGRILSSFESLSAIGAVPGPRTAAAFARLHRADFIAGLSVIGLLLPEAVAYAGIAGMPPASGLIALFCGLACYRPQPLRDCVRHEFLRSRARRRCRDTLRGPGGRGS